MRALILGPDEKLAIAKVVAWAMEPKNFFDEPAIARGFIPGEHPEYVATIPMGFKAVFTLTRREGKLFRHLTISVDGPLYPSVESCVALAEEFGFTATAPENNFDLILRMKNDGWIFAPDKHEHCVMLAQPVDVEPKPAPVDPEDAVCKHCKKVIRTVPKDYCPRSPNHMHEPVGESK